LKLGEINHTVASPDLSLAYSPFALLLRQKLGEWRKQEAIARAKEQRVKFGSSLRELQASLNEADKMPANESLEYANRFAKAIDKRNIHVLLNFLDTANDCNQVTKKAVQETFGIKVIGMNSEERRKVIFTFCGYNNEQRVEFEKEVAEKRTATIHARDVEQAKKKAESVKVRYAGEILSGSEYVDRSFAEGYTVITTNKKGATTQYWLSNPDAGCSRSIQKNNGTLAYARLVCGATEFRQAA
jgi:hypothetical protein